MKQTLRILLIFSLLIAGSKAVYAQCEGADQYTSSGIYPLVLPEACDQQSYDETVFIVAPEDTSIEGQSVRLDSVTVLDIVNLPNGITYDCGDCVFVPDNDGYIRACVNLSGAVNDPAYGTNNFTVKARLYGEFTGFSFDFNSPVDYDQSFTVNDCVTSVEETTVTNSIQIYPMPLNTNSVIELNLNSKGSVSTEVYNVIGKKVVSTSPRIYPAGKHKLNLGNKLSSFQPGIYIVKVNIGDQSITKRVILN